MNPISLEAFTIGTSQFVINSVLDDCHWQMLGLSARPRRGKMMRVFVNDKKLVWEDCIKKELACLALSEIAAWSAADSFPHRVKLLARIIEIAIDGFGTPAWSALSFSSRDHAVEYFTMALPAYGLSDIAEHSKVFYIRTMPSVPRDELPTWVVRCSKLTAMPEALYPHIRFGLTKGSAGKIYADDIELADLTILTAVRQLFGVSR
jgi:hypothetical protein